MTLTFTPRLHAIIFTLRPFSVFLFGYFCQNFWPVGVGINPIVTLEKQLLIMIGNLVLSG
jgi:hypothetical protein